MNELKPWYKSKAVWGGLVAFAAGMLQLAFGIEVDADTQQQIVETALAASGSVGGILALIGRLNAKQGIK